MTMFKAKRSPLFYVGDKHKLIGQLLELFPKEIHCFVDLFCGGGSVSLNNIARKFIMNDNNPYIIDIHRFLNKNKLNFNEMANGLYKIINEYNLSHSEKNIVLEIKELKKLYPKTYFAKYNKESYLKLRSDYNQTREIEKLYLLLIYGFNHMIRFNKNNEFNLPVGNVDWNKNVTTALENYIIWANNNDISYWNLDFEYATSLIDWNKDDFLYCDPPYLITFSEYNKNWTEKEEHRLYNLLNELHKKGIKWGLSNMLSHKGKENHILKEWSSQYSIFDIKSNYISRFDNSIKKDSREIYVANYI